MKKKFVIYLGRVIGSCSMIFAILGANTTCMFVCHQPVFSDKLKLLRKF